MRSLIVVCLLAGCYQPVTDSCHYRCATQGQACPNGLECVAGNMCATPGTTSCPTTGGDATMSDTVPVIDSPAACGNGMATAGEICYGPVLTFGAPGGPMDGVLADRNGDSRLDLIYLTSSGVRSHPNTGMALATVVSQGTTASNLRSMRPAQLNANMSAELLIASDVDLQSWAYSTGTDFSMTARYNPITLVNTFEYGKMTDSAFGDVVLLVGSDIRVFGLDGPSTATPRSTTPVAINAQSKLALGHLITTDQRIDVVLLSPVGITTYVGSAAGLTGPGNTLSVGSTVTDLRIGDIDGDGDGDIVYVVQSQGAAPMGQIGLLLNTGSGTFAPPQITMLMDLGGALEVADLDNDGRADVIAVRTGAQRALLVYRGRTDGALEPAVAFQLPGLSARISARGSFNGDTVPDIVVTDTQGNNVYVFPSNP